MIVKSLKIKVCGLNNKTNIINIAKIKPDYMGFIYYKYSKRYVGNKFNIPFLAKKIKKVGVFVNENEDFILKKSFENKLDFVQLHGDEDINYCYNIKNKGIKIIKSFGIDDNFNFRTIKLYKNICNFFLFDNKTDNYGGSGKKFLWKKIDDYNLDIPFFISGGIALSDINNILSISHPCFLGVDINSKFEIKNGIKNLNIVDNFIKKLRKNELLRK